MVALVRCAACVNSHVSSPKAGKAVPCNEWATVVQKLTTSQRTNAAVEQYWARRRKGVRCVVLLCDPEPGVLQVVVAPISTCLYARICMQVENDGRPGRCSPNSKSPTRPCKAGAVLVGLVLISLVLVKLLSAHGHQDMFTFFWHVSPHSSSVVMET